MGLEQIEAFNVWYYSPKSRKRNWEKARKLSGRLSMETLLSDIGTRESKLTLVRSFKHIKELYGESQEPNFTHDT